MVSSSYNYKLECIDDFFFAPGLIIIGANEHVYLHVLAADEDVIVSHYQRTRQQQLNPAQPAQSAGRLYEPAGFLRGFFRSARRVLMPLMLVLRAARRVTVLPLLVREYQYYCTSTTSSRTSTNFSDTGGSTRTSTYVRVLYSYEYQQRSSYYLIVQDSRTSSTRTYTRI